MADMVTLHSMLLDTQAAIERAKRAIADAPERPSLVATMKSLVLRQQDLELKFLKETDRVGYDVCSYRMISEEDSGSDPSILAITSILSGFQNLFTLTFDAIIHGPKRHAVISHELEERTTFGFGYAFAGSTGVVLTIPRDRQKDLFGQSTCDQTAQSIFTMLNVKTPADVKAVASEYGPSAVRSLLKFVESHLRYRIAADVEWRRSMSPISSGLLQCARFQEIENAILQTDIEIVDKMAVIGLLEGANVRNKRFSIVTDEGNSISGSFEDAIDDSHTVELPKKYRATITRTAKIQFSTDEEQESYFLERIDGPV